MRRSLLCALSALLLTFTAPLTGHAQDAGAAGGIPTEQASGFVRSIETRAVEDVLTADVSHAEKLSRFRTLFGETFDVPAIARFVLGRYARALTPEDREAFTATFNEVIVYTWARRFTQYYTDQQLDILNVFPDGPTGALVNSAITGGDGPPILVTWRLRDRGDRGLRVVDVDVENVSMGRIMRQDYATVIRNNGNEVSALTAQLSEQVGQLRADWEALATGNSLTTTAGSAP